MVELLEPLDYSAERRRKVEAGLRHATTGKLSQSTSSKWVPFLNKGRLRQRKERDGLCLSSAMPKIEWDSNPHCPYGY